MKYDSVRVVALRPFFPLPVRAVRPLAASTSPLRHYVRSPMFAAAARHTQIPHAEVVDPLTGDRR